MTDHSQFLSKRWPAYVNLCDLQGGRQSSWAKLLPPNFSALKVTVVQGVSYEVLAMVVRCFPGVSGRSAFLRGVLPATRARSRVSKQKLTDAKAVWNSKSSSPEERHAF